MTSSIPDPTTTFQATGTRDITGPMPGEIA
jgi:hypothetical protein